MATKEVSPVAYIKLKDNSTTYYISKQKISLLGGIPKKVKLTGEIRGLLKSKVAEKVTKAEFEKYEKEQAERIKNYEESQKEVKNELAEKIEEVTTKIESAISTSDINEADAYLNVLIVLDKENSKIETYQNQIEEIHLKKADSELKEELELAKKEVKELIKSKVITLEKGVYSFKEKSIGESLEDVISFYVENKGVFGKDA